MAVVKATIKASLLNLYNQCKIDDGLTEDEFADNMADIIRNAILSANVTTTLTPGTAIAGPYPVTGGASTGGLS